MPRLPGYTQQDTNRIQGKFFEEALELHARLRGFYIEKNHLAAKYIAKGKIQTYRADLDYKIIHRGITGFFDCKSFDGEKFGFTQITGFQLDKSLLYAERGVPTGFIVYFRPINEVRYFHPTVIARSGSGSSLKHTQGVLLGKIEGIDLAIVFSLQTDRQPHQPLPTGTANSKGQGRLW